MGSFQRLGLTFSVDRDGVELDPSERIDFEVAYEDLGFTDEKAPEQLGARLSELTGERVEDDDGIYDLAVHRDGALVAAVALCCEEGVLVFAGERVEGLADEDLAQALCEALDLTN